jgi:hypothetical protein
MQSRSTSYSNHEQGTHVTRTIQGLDGLIAAAGEHLGDADPVAITQEMVDDFQRATGGPADTDGQVPPFLLVSFGPRLAPQIYSVQGQRATLNYGCKGITFGAPVPVGAEVGLAVSLDSCDPVGDEAVQVTTRFAYTVRGESEPACVVLSEFRYLG